MTLPKRAALAGAVLALAVPTPATAHLERPSYWPDPAPDTSVTPPAGGKVPAARSLRSAVMRKGPGKVRVVCQGKRGRLSLRKAIRSIRSARKKGFRVRPSQPVVRYTRKRAKRMRKFNRKLRKRCHYRTIQAAVNRSGNNDRIVIMPGRYLEQRSRKQPVNDPRCNPGMLQLDASGDPAPSYAYQVNCPHDQNLVYIQGRALTGSPLDAPRTDRQGIPEQELGECVRCNLQIEGSGVKPTDVIIDAGKDYQGKGPEAKPLGHAKHVALRIDRGDGFVGRNFTMVGASEHGFYAEETDGILLDRTKFFWNADYGHLTFTSDHNVVKNCDGFGSGDAVVYPGASPETGSQATDFYPDAPRYNTTITKCDLRGSALGYSGSMGNAVRITNNHNYGNTTGSASDTLSSAGHPGFPTDSSQIDNNYIYSNNFDIYAEDSPVKPLVPVPIGVGVLYAGMNDALVHDNWFFDNWRFATMLFAVPDALTSAGGAEGDVFPGVSCAGAPENGISTSCGNRYFDNKMGQIPPGFRFPDALDQFGVPHGDAPAANAPNGTDFWWDGFTSNRWNCWFDNSGPDGTPGSIVGSGPMMLPLPDCDGGANPDASVGPGDPTKTVYLVDCSEGPDEDEGPLDCDWWRLPPRPGGAAASSRAREVALASRRFARSAEGRRVSERMSELARGG